MPAPPTGTGRLEGNRTHSCRLGPASDMTSSVCRHSTLEQQRDERGWVGDNHFVSDGLQRAKKPQNVRIIRWLEGRATSVCIKRELCNPRSFAAWNRCSLTAAGFDKQGCTLRYKQGWTAEFRHLPTIRMYITVWTGLNNWVQATSNSSGVHYGMNRAEQLSSGIFQQFGCTLRYEQGWTAEFRHLPTVRMYITVWTGLNNWVQATSNSSGVHYGINRAEQLSSDIFQKFGCTLRYEQGWTAEFRHLPAIHITIENELTKDF
jgi:nitrogen fixation protein